MNTHTALYNLSTYRKNLTRQQFKTLRGQILAGNPEAADKGLRKILKEKKGVRNNDSKQSHA